MPLMSINGAHLLFLETLTIQKTMQKVQGDEHMTKQPIKTKQSALLNYKDAYKRKVKTAVDPSKK